MASLVFLLLSLPAIAQVRWREIQPGLRCSSHPLREKSAPGDSHIFLLDIDPEKFEFELLSASERGKGKKTLSRWCRENALLAGINAGMFVPGISGELLSVGYMQNYGHINQPATNNYSQWIAFHPKKPGLPSFRIFDADCENVSALKDDYHSLIQANTLMNCRRKITWQEDGRKFSMVLLGMDNKGHCLMMHCRTPYHPARLAGLLAEDLPGLQRLVFLDGGSISSFFLTSPALKKSLTGSYQTRFSEHDRNRRFRPLPNVLGIRKK